MAIENKELATIKKPGKVEYISKEEYQSRIAEITRCKRDIIYFLETYFRITNLDKGLHVVKLYDIQKDFINFMKDNNRVICCSGRQQGKSSCYCMYVLWLTCFHPDKSVLILAQRENTAIEILKKVKDGYLYLPTWLKPSCVELNKKSITFGNRSTIHVFSSSADGARGTSASILILDEFSFVPDHIADKLFTSVYPVVSSAKDGKIILVSTPNSQQGLFYELWKKANSKDIEKNKDGWKPFQMWWWQVPGHDEKWKEQQIQSIGKERFEQEFNNSFLANSTIKKLIPDDIIEKHRIELSKNKERASYKGKDLAIFSKDNNKTYVFKMFKKFDTKRTYICSSDAAEGIGKDSSVLYIWDITDTSNIEMVAKFSDNTISILEFAFVTHQILKMYGNPFIACESNGISLGYIEQLRVTYEYENFIRLNRDNGCGIQSHMQVKTKACLWYRDMMTTMGFGFTLRDLALIDEMGTFIKKDTKVHDVYAAIGDNHDDHIMTMIWMTWILNEENIEKYFVVSDYFTSSLGNQYPKTISPIYDYTKEEIEFIENIPQVKEFNTYMELNKEDYASCLSEQQRMQMQAMKMLGQNVIVNDQIARQQEYNKVTVYSQEEMLRGLRRNPGSSYSRANDNSLIFGTGSSISQTIPMNGSVFNWGDDDGNAW